MCKFHGISFLNFRRNEHISYWVAEVPESTLEVDEEVGSHERVGGGKGQCRQALLALSVSLCA